MIVKLGWQELIRIKSWTKVNVFSEASVKVVGPFRGAGDGSPIRVFAASDHTDKNTKNFFTERKSRIFRDVVVRKISDDRGRYCLLLGERIKRWIFFREFFFVTIVMIGHVLKVSFSTCSPASSWSPSTATAAADRSKSKPTVRFNFLLFCFRTFFFPTKSWRVLTGRRQDGCQHIRLETKYQKCCSQLHRSPGKLS